MMNLYHMCKDPKIIYINFSFSLNIHNLYHIYNNISFDF